jgi:hypothetical protein
MKTLALLICGDRKWEKRAPIQREVAKLMDEYTIVTVIHGACKGADTIGGEVSETLRLPVEEFPADWEQYGKAAGPIRNSFMLKRLLKVPADKKLVLAFHPCLRFSKGTVNMVRMSRNAGVEVKVIEK